VAKSVLTVVEILLIPTAWLKCVIIAVIIGWDSMVATKIIDRIKKHRRELSCGAF